MKLTDVSPDRFNRLTTQMKWRLLEGGGEALYEIGVLGWFPPPPLLSNPVSFRLLEHFRKTDAQIEPVFVVGAWGCGQTMERLSDSRVETCPPPSGRSNAWPQS